MRIILKISIYLALLVFAALISGSYGALHDQVSYSFSHEYFTRFKFIQFSIPWAYDAPRLGAAYVGFLATWWMGVLVFVFLGLLSFLFKQPMQMLKYSIQAMLVVALVALVTGLAGLAIGYIQVNQSTISAYAQWIHPGVNDPVQFIRVGFMHNAGYLGGATGFVAGVTYLLWKKGITTKDRS